jgi:hypothetical protein
MSATAPPTPYIGQPLRRREDGRCLTRKRSYVDDIALPVRVYMAILESLRRLASLA